MPEISHNIRALGVDPTARGYAFALLEGSERLIDWGLADLHGGGEEKFLKRLSKLLERTRPHVMVIETLHDSALRIRARGQLKLIRELGERQSIPVVSVSRREVRRMFAISGSKKAEIAQALSLLFPELVSWLPRERQPWTSEDERMGIFDALSLAITVLRHHERGNWPLT